MPECGETRTELSPSEARLILEPYFDEIQERFVAAGLARVGDTRLKCTEGLHDTPRHFAGCIESGKIIYAAPEMAELPVEIVCGILAHELGHAADFLYPGEFLLRGDSVVMVAPDRERLKGWKRRDDDSVEFSADRIAELVLGTSIGYRGPCKLQALGFYNPRPKGLR